MALAEARPVSLALADGAARHSFARITEVAPIPNLIKVQRDSFEWFLREGLKELFAEISPIQDFTSRNMDLELAVNKQPDCLNIIGQVKSAIFEVGPPRRGSSCPRSVCRVQLRHRT